MWIWVTIIVPGIAGFLIANYRATRLLQGLLLVAGIGWLLTIFTPDGERLCSAPGLPGPQATMILNNWRSIRRLLIDGDIGLAEAYRDAYFQHRTAAARRFDQRAQCPDPGAFALLAQRIDFPDPLARPHEIFRAP